MNGKLIHFNTIEEYNAFNFEDLNDIESPTVHKFELRQDIERAMEKCENYFLLVCFGDLKQYNYHYKTAVLQLPETFESLKGTKLSKVFDAEALQRLEKAVVATVQAHEGEVPQAFAIEEQGAKHLCFLDNAPKHPSIFLNNLLHRESLGVAERTIGKIVLVKEKVARNSESLDGLSSSFYCEVAYEPRSGGFSKYSFKQT